MAMFFEGPRAEIQHLPGETPTFAFSGELDETNVDKLFTQLYANVGSNWKKGIVFDFSELKYLNSKAIGYITDICGLVDDHKGEFSIIHANENVYDILDIVGVTKIVSITKKS